MKLEENFTFPTGRTGVMWYKEGYGRVLTRDDVEMMEGSEVSASVP